MTTLVPVKRIAIKIYLIRDTKAMLDRDLAELYGVETKVFNAAVEPRASQGGDSATAVSPLEKRSRLQRP